VHMMLVGSLLSWWYGLGWAKLIQKVGGRVRGVLDFFSVTQLAGSLFVPYKQISATAYSHGTVGDQLRSWGDKQFARFFGAFVRLVLILAGLAAAAIIGLLGLVLVAVWPFLPVLPFVGIFLMQVRVGA
jgi:hypothetical protein